MDIRNGNCLDELKSIPDKSIDLFICDLPYGETNCKWDSIIDLEEFWKEFKRVRKSKKTACIHFCSTKFGYSLIKSNEKMFKMDMVWKKRNKTGGLQSRHRPMRNHEMVYFFYEQAPKYNRDKYHKRIEAKKPTKPTKPASVVEEQTIYNIDKDKTHPTGNGLLYEPPNPASVVEETNSTRKGKDIFGNNEKRDKPFNYEPPNPASVLEETGSKKNKDEFNKNGGMVEISKYKDKHQSNSHFEPPNPSSVLVEEDQVYSKKGWRLGEKQGSKEFRDELKSKGLTGSDEPPNPASILEEETKPRKSIKERKGVGMNNVYTPDHNKEWLKNYKGFTPLQPTSIVEEDYIIPAEDEPVSMYESKKVFIGKRHHQTEKPIDILEFFLKYWTDEDDVVLDPTMGSGSTGVACKNLNRKFIGFELDEKIFKVAEKRINNLK